jgi:hypothetical protein
MVSTKEFKRCASRSTLFEISLQSDDSVPDEHHSHHGERSSLHTDPKEMSLQPRIKAISREFFSQAGTSIAAMAMRHGINANIVHC